MISIVLNAGSINKKRMMYFDKSDNLYKCRGFKLTIEQPQEFKDYYSVIPFPHDEFTGNPIRLTEEQRKEFVKQCLG